ncbi:AraC family transcriptional regulator [Paenibacillus sp. FSL H7-0357]|nr:AraC family transcriptional regulator [Paenibacillus sp. FSL H7-0357]
MEPEVTSPAEKDAETLPDWDQLSFRLLSVQALRGDGEVRLPQQLNFCYALILVAGGAVRIHVDHRQVELSAGSVCLCLPEQTIGTAKPAASLDMHIFYFEVYHYGKPENVRDHAIHDALLFPPDTILPHFPAKQISSVCSEVFRISGAGQQNISFRAQIDFQELLYVIRMSCRQKPRDTGRALEQAKQYIEDHFTEPLTTQELAQAAELSPKYFVDLFKRKYGKSAVEYAAELRLQQAKRLMAESGLKLRDIAHRVGYADEFYFSRKFKKMIGVPPAVYMKSRHRKLVAYTPAVLGQLLPLNLTPYAAALHPKWTEYYYLNYRGDIPVHISAYRNNQEWQANIDLLSQYPADLIIARDELKEQEKTALEKIAPVYYSHGGSCDWRGQFQELAQVLGESWQGEQWLSAYDREVRSAKELLHKAMGDESVAVIRMLGSKLYLYCNHGILDMLYRELDLKPAFKSGEGIYNVPVTLEELAALPADHLFMLIRRENDTLGEWQKLQNHPLWLKLSAVQRHRVHHMSSDPWREHSAYAQLRMLRQTLQLLAANRP